MSVNPHSLGRANGSLLQAVSTVRLVRDQPNLLRDFFGREDEVDAAAFYCALRHIRLNGSIELLCNRDTTNIFDGTKRGRPITIVSRNDDRDQLTGPVLGKRAQEDSDDIGPSPWLALLHKSCQGFIL